MSDGQLVILHHRHRCVYHGRQLGRSGVTSTARRGVLSAGAFTSAGLLCTNHSAINEPPNRRNSERPGVPALAILALEELVCVHNFANGFSEQKSRVTGRDKSEWDNSSTVSR